MTQMAFIRYLVINDERSSVHEEHYDIRCRAFWMRGVAVIPTTALVGVSLNCLFITMRGEGVCLF
jgi:hypothetical protein